jgi:hypothetical protein
MRCLDRHPSGNRTPHAGSEDTTTACKTRRNRHISRMQQERPGRCRGSTVKKRYRSLGANTTQMICMMMSSYNNFVAELLVIFRGIYDGGGPLMSCAKPLSAFQLRFDHLSIVQLPFKPRLQFLNRYRLSLSTPIPALSFASRSFIGRRSAIRPACVTISCRVFPAC